MTMQQKDPMEWLRDNRRHFSREMNGYSDIPIKAYFSTLPLIDRDGHVADLGCGNGMLLKFIMNFSGHLLVPYGIDVNEKAVREAKEAILPADYADNFRVCDVMDYDFREGPFEIIISNPLYACQKGKKPRIMEFTEACLGSLSPGGRLIYRVHRDGLESEGEGSTSGPANLNVERIRKMSDRLASLPTRSPDSAMRVHS